MSDHISCSEYDYFEIACTFKLKVQLTLSNGGCVSGTAESLRIEKQNDTAKEVLLLSSPQCNVDLLDVVTMKALTQNPHFTEVRIHAPQSGK